MTAWRDRVAGLTGWRRRLLSFLLGAVAAAALPPLHAVPVLLVSIPGLLWLIASARTGREAFAVGWWFGFGHFLIGLYWIANALLVDAARFAWLIPAAVVGLPAALAVFPGLAAAVQRALAPRGAAAVPAFAVAWVAAEWLRGHLFTGFPWNLLGYSWTFSVEMLQIASVVGVYGLSLITVAVAGLPALLGDGEARRSVAGLQMAGILLLALLWGYGHLRLAPAPSLAASDVLLRIVQANIDQEDKWRADRRDANFRRYLAMSGAAGSPDVTIWPETAVPYFLSRESARRRAIAALLAPGAFLVTGAPRISAPARTPVTIWNSVVAIDRSGAIAATYDKFHLVPFGEYLPLRGVLARLGIDKLVYGPVDYTAGPGPALMRLATVPAFAPLICYEAIFPGAAAETAVRPAWLLNVSNDAWYGISAGPHQHFAMARVRSVEEGLPLVRAANTGISGVVDSFGRVVARVGLGEAGAVDVPLPRALDSATPYGRFGDLTTLGLALLALAPAGLAAAAARPPRRRRTPRSGPPPT